MKEDQVIHVALATDSTYLPWCAVAILSSQRATPQHAIHAHVLEEGDLLPTVRDALAEVVQRGGGEVSYHTVAPERLAALPSKGTALGGWTSWLRIFLPELLPDVDRIVYLDADTLTVDAIDELWTLPLDAPLAAVANVVEPAKHQHVRDLGIEDPARYFNAGVLVMDLAAMREERTFDAVMSVVEAHRELAWFDQDALNVVFAGRWHDLPPRWNAQNSLWFWPTWAADVFSEQAVH